MMKRIWVTRAKEELDSAKKIVEKYGFEFLGIPLIEIEKLNIPVLKENFEAIVFSSKTGVRFFFEEKFLRDILKKAKIVFCVGKETQSSLKNYLEKYYININLAPLPKKFQGEDLANLLLKYNIKSILAPGPKKRRKVLFDILKDKKINIVKLDLYQTKIRKLNQEEKNLVLTSQAVTLTSPSTFQALLENNLLKFLLKNQTHFLVIGDVTAKEVRKYVPSNLIIKPDIFTFEEMIKTYKNYLNRSRL